MSTETETETENLDEIITGEAQDADEAEDVVETPPEDKAAAGDVKAKADPESEKMVPLSALEAERKQWRERLQFAEEVARQQRQAPKQEQAKPDPIDFLTEPDKIGGYIDQKISEAAQNLSRRYAIRSHGQETVQAAYDALRQHGTEAEKAALIASDDPWGEVVHWHKRRQVMADIGDDPEAWRQRERDRLRKELLAEAAVSEAKGKTPVPPSMATDTNLGARTAGDFDGPTPLSQLFSR